MRLAIRICGGVALAFLVLGYVYFIGTSAFMCFDICPSPSAFPGAALQQAGVSFGPGLLLALVTWLLFLVALARVGRRRGLAIAIGVPVILVVVVVVLLAFIPHATLLPTTAEEYSGWVGKLMAAGFATFVLVAVMLALAPPGARRTDNP